MKQLYKGLLVALVSIFSLSACEYSPEPLPKHILSDYEVAFPLADTAIHFANFFQNDSRPVSQQTISKANPVVLTLEFPTYLTDFTDRGYTLFWIEPKIFVDNSFTDKLAISFSYHARAKNGSIHLLLGNHDLQKGENSQMKVERITESNLPIAQIDAVYVNITLRAKEDGIPTAELLEGRLGLKLGLKVSMKAGFGL